MIFRARKNHSSSPESGSWRCYGIYTRNAHFIPLPWKARKEKPCWSSAVTLHGRVSLSPSERIMNKECRKHRLAHTLVHYNVPHMVRSHGLSPLTCRVAKIWPEERIQMVYKFIYNNICIYVYKCNIYELNYFVLLFCTSFTLPLNSPV